MFREYVSFRFVLVLFASCVTAGYSRRSFAALSNYDLFRQKHNIQQLTVPFLHAEGPHWDADKQLLFFVDISGFRIYQYDPCSKKVTFAEIGAPVGVVIPVAGISNKFIIGRGTTLSVITWNGENSTSAPIETIHHIESDKPRNRFNDGKTDRAGRLWIGTMGNEDPVTGVEPKQGSLYRFSNSTCKLEQIITGVSISNGIAWSLDNRFMYFIDTPTRRVERFNYNINTGDISNRQTVIDFEKENVTGSPDGMTIDNKGNLWIACWGGSKVINVDSTTGKVIYVIPLPVERVTSVTFGGKYFDTLFVTTMKKGLTPEQIEQQPAAGAVFSVSNLPASGHYNVPVATRCVKSRR